MHTALLETARQWAEHDPDPKTKAEILALIAAQDIPALQAAFHGPLAFGTAGLRAPVGAGESRLSRAVVIRTTYGLVSWLKEKIGAAPKIVIGCDARYGSADFYKDAAEVISAAGGTALILPPQNPTPLTAFTVKKLSCDAGIMVTASHNPPADNGYKVYLGGRVEIGAGEGVQIVPPADKEIAAAIAAAPFADEIARNRDNIQEIDTRAAYLERALQLASPAGGTAAASIVTIALTAMHGVGAKLGEELLSRAGYQVSLVPEQAEPDPDFPTVSFPNPEEPGALDLSKTHAQRIGGDVIIAYDPDADRCAVATPDTNAANGWRQLTGDELGALLGDYLASRKPAGAFANSIVSGRLLSKIAAGYGRPHTATLTGFKWIARTPELVYGYEEAIGYCCDPQAVADKDGISTSLVVAAMVADLKASGSNLDEALDNIYRKHGFYHTAPLTFRVEDLQLIADGMSKLRANPPQELAGAAVVEVRDMAKDELGIGATEGMYFRSSADDRVICRPSGTEPKLKCYLEVVLPVGADGIIPKAAAKERIAQIAAELRTFLDI
ncbi:phospho-sugar mutase [Corynebacterium caspium]|uniref:phospho-sugar mutase n=1 Tax=Corynebacterium caspium TaxID=234828 RepID=UPI00035DA3D4|nr:phospho-sugar mutase [Corynebacterium caspium]WKD58470.1 putative phosphomannomutase [Corynebacterium caspium DSM 44850]